MNFNNIKNKQCAVKKNVAGILGYDEWTEVSAFLACGLVGVDRKYKIALRDIKPESKDFTITPKEKAKELIEKFLDANKFANPNWKIENAQVCALTAVDVILRDTGAEEWEEIETGICFWEEVKKEILKIKYNDKVSSKSGLD